MTEGNEVRASHEEVEGFVARLKEFHGSLGGPQQAMLVTILEGAQGGAETGGYAKRGAFRHEEPEGRGGSGQQHEEGSTSSSGWNDLVGWLEGQSEGEDTQGFAARYSW